MEVKRIRKIGVWIIVGVALIVLLGVNLVGKAYLADAVSKIALMVLIAWIVAMAVWSQFRQ